MKSVIEEGFIGVDMPPLPDEIWRGVRLLQLTEIDSPAYTTSTTSATFTAWLSPVTEAVTYSGTASLYGIICENNPVNFVDPYGLWAGWASGEPVSTGESFVPIWGSGRQAVNDFSTGHYVWGSVNTVMAVSDIFLVKTAATAIGKGAWKLGSHSWSATRAWMGKTGRAEAEQQVHHWAVPQGRWGKNVPDWFKNQPWNLMSMEDELLHQSIHGIGRNPFGPLGQFMYGTPDWFKALLISEYGRVANELRDQGQDDCK